VTQAQWRRGVQASRRVGRWLASWEERGRQAREGKAPEPETPRKTR
jgi:hypothetical protein